MKHKVAVYGSLKKDFENHGWIRGSKFLGNERIEGFALHSLGLFPAAVPMKGQSIMTEVYEISAETLMRIDALEGHTGIRDRSYYFRETIQTRFGDTFLYVFQKDITGKPKVDNGWW